MPEFFAHSSPLGNPPPEGWQSLRDHLGGVARKARLLAEQTGLAGIAEAAEAAGWLHDLGKYRHEFQEFIQGRPPKGSKHHKQAGAAWAAKAADTAVAFAILGHHHGLPDRDDAARAIKGDDGIGILSEVEGPGVAECPELKSLPLATRTERSAAAELFIRILLSCLVDADWTDTTEHERLVRGWPRFPTPPGLDPATRLDTLLGFIRQRALSNHARNPHLATLRQSVLEACLVAADSPSGLFSLTVPTGGGKTLSGTAFALRHAATNGLRRVIYVAPYISILDQNAAVLRDALGVTAEDLDVLEHQSLAEPQGRPLVDEKQTAIAARLAENWDSPIVLTTNVQFFESLFSNRPSNCRKLHNIAKSVVILDECQALPPDLVKPTCQMLRQLTVELGCSVVLCTATQPAFSHDCLKDVLHDHRLSTHEVIPPSLKLFASLARVRIEWPLGDARLPWPEVASLMRASPAALCVVNTKRAARDLFSELRGSASNVYHLSTDMCPAHRLTVLATAKRHLQCSEPVYLVSTQLIEAGVDIDFPVVLREMAPLESIIQAAGRCNREGRIPDAGGRVVVFRSVDGALPSGWYTLGRDVLETEFLATGHEPRVEDPGDVYRYFHHLYWKRSLDPKNLIGMRNGFQFESVAREYRLIRDDTVSVVVATWEAHAQRIESLLKAARQRPDRANLRALAPFQVNMFRPELARAAAGVAAPLSEDLDVLVWYGRYDPDCGRSSDCQDILEAI